MIIPMPEPDEEIEIADFFLSCGPDTIRFRTTAEKVPTREARRAPVVPMQGTQAAPKKKKSE